MTSGPDIDPFGKRILPWVNLLKDNQFAPLPEDAKSDLENPVLNSP